MEYRSWYRLFYKMYLMERVKSPIFHVRYKFHFRGVRYVESSINNFVEYPCALVIMPFLQKTASLSLPTIEVSQMIHAT